MKGPVILVGGPIAIVAMSSGLAFATWISGAAGSASAISTSIGEGATPTATVDTGAVTLTWPVVTLNNGDPIEGYTVRRFSSPGALESVVTGSCSGIVAVATCTEPAVPDGRWMYSITPKVLSWKGSASAPSQEVLVDVTPPVTTPPSTSNDWRKSVTLPLVADDELSDVSATYYTTDGSTPTTSSTQGNSVTVSTTGTHTVKYFSVDSNGNAESVQTATVKIDTDGPTGTFTAPLNGAAINGDTPVTTTFTDAHAGLHSIGYYYRLNNETQLRYMETGSANAQPRGWNSYFTAGNGAAGSQFPAGTKVQFYAYAYDNVDHVIAGEDSDAYNTNNPHNWTLVAGPQVTVGSAAPATATTFTVTSGTASTAWQNKNQWTASVPVTVSDNLGVALSGYTVTASITPSIGSKNCVTDAAGTCNILSGNIPAGTASVTYTFTGATKAGSTLTLDGSLPADRAISQPGNRPTN